MATDEDQDATGNPKLGLKELFSGRGEDQEPTEGDSPGTESMAENADDTAAAEGSTTGMGTSIDAELDDAEILTESDASAGPVPEGTATGEPAMASGTDHSVDDELTPGGPSVETSSPEGSTPDTGTPDATPDAGPELPHEGSDAETLTEESADSSERSSEAEASADPLPPTARNRLTTGIEMLDRELEGGIPPGRMLSLVAPPETQSELLVKEMAISRPTMYISTFRPEWEIREELHDHLQKSDDDRLLDNELQVSYVDPEDLLAEPMEYIGDLPKGSNLIIDSINEFELEDRKRYVEFLNTVKEVLWDTGSIGLFYGIEEATDPPARSLTLKRSDVVWQLDRSVTTHEIQTILIISKFRGGKALTEPVKLVLTDDVQVDMSRDIG